MGPCTTNTTTAAVPYLARQFRNPWQRLVVRIRDRLDSALVAKLAVQRPALSRQRGGASRRHVTRHPTTITGEARCWWQAASDTASQACTCCAACDACHSRLLPWHGWWKLLGQSCSCHPCCWWPCHSHLQQPCRAATWEGPGARQDMLRRRALQRLQPDAICSAEPAAVCLQHASNRQLRVGRRCMLSRGAPKRPMPKWQPKARPQLAG